MNRTRSSLLATVAAVAAVALAAPGLQAQTTPPPVEPVAQPDQPAPVSPPPGMQPAPKAAHKAAKAAKEADKPARGMAERFIHLDTDRDGSISRQEAAAAPQLAQQFDGVDADKDGRVQPSELKDYAKTQRRDKGAKKSKMDSNGDGMVTRDDFTGKPKALAKFDAADTDKDGRLSPQEAKAAKGK